MLHLDLKVNGKKLSSEKELERFFSLETFSCNIGYTFLQVEYSDGRAAFIGWGDEYSDEVFYFDNGSRNLKSVALCINVCPQERMMCYDDNVIRDIVIYYCQTGERNPKYKWIEDVR